MLRASGTEPKIKYYAELSTDEYVAASGRPALRKKLDDFIRPILEALLVPTANKLTPASAE